MPADGKRFDLGDVLELRNPSGKHPARTVEVVERMGLNYGGMAAMSRARDAPADPVEGRTPGTRVERARRRNTEYRVKPINKASGRQSITTELNLRENYRRIQRGSEKI